MARKCFWSHSRLGIFFIQDNICVLKYDMYLTTVHICDLKQCKFTNWNGSYLANIIGLEELYPFYKFLGKNISALFLVSGDCPHFFICGPLSSPNQHWLHLSHLDDSVVISFKSESESVVISFKSLFWLLLMTSFCKFKCLFFFNFFLFKILFIVFFWL